MEILAAVVLYSIRIGNKRGRHVVIDFLHYMDVDKEHGDGGQRWNAIAKFLEPTTPVATITTTLILINQLLTHHFQGFHHKR